MNHKLIIFSFIIVLFPLIALEEGFIGPVINEVTVGNISTFTMSNSHLYIYTKIKKNGIITHRITAENTNILRYRPNTYVCTKGNIKDCNPNELERAWRFDSGECKDS